MSLDDGVLISIHKKWCDQIRSGRKTIELRRKFSGLEDFNYFGGILYIHETGSGKIVMRARVLVQVIRNERKREMWRKYWNRLGNMTEGDFYAYIGDREIFYMIHIKEFQAVAQFPWPRGPQGYQYMRADMIPKNALFTTMEVPNEHQG